MKVRVHQIAKKAGRSSREVLEYLLAQGHGVKSASSTVDEEVAVAVVKLLRGKERGSVLLQNRKQAQMRTRLRDDMADRVSLQADELSFDWIHQDYGQLLSLTKRELKSLLREALISVSALDRASIESPKTNLVILPRCQSDIETFNEGKITKKFNHACNDIRFTSRPRHLSLAVGSKLSKTSPFYEIKLSKNIRLVAEIRMPEKVVVLIRCLTTRSEDWISFSDSNFQYLPGYKPGVEGFLPSEALERKLVDSAREREKSMGMVVRCIKFLEAFNEVVRCESDSEHQVALDLCQKLFELISQITLKGVPWFPEDIISLATNLLDDIWSSLRNEHSLPDEQELGNALAGLDDSKTRISLLLSAASFRAKVSARIIRLRLSLQNVWNHYQGKTIGEEWRIVFGLSSDEILGLEHKSVPFENFPTVEKSVQFLLVAMNQGISLASTQPKATDDEAPSADFRTFFFSIRSSLRSLLKSIEMLRENNSLGEHGLSSKDKPNELIANLTYSYERLLGFFVRMNFTKKELDSGKELFHASRRLWELFRKGKSTEPSRTKTGFKSYAESVSNAVHQERKKKIEKGLKERVESYLNKSWHLKNTLGEFPSEGKWEKKDLQDLLAASRDPFPPVVKKRVGIPRKKQDTPDLQGFAVESDFRVIAKIFCQLALWRFLSASEKPDANNPFYFAGKASEMHWDSVPSSHLLNIDNWTERNLTWDDMRIVELTRKFYEEVIPHLASLHEDAPDVAEFIRSNLLAYKGDVLPLVPFFLFCHATIDLLFRDLESLRSESPKASQKRAMYLTLHLNNESTTILPGNNLIPRISSLSWQVFEGERGAKFDSTPSGESHFRIEGMNKGNEIFKELPEHPIEDALGAFARACSDVDAIYVNQPLASKNSLACEFSRIKSPFLFRLMGIPFYEEAPRGNMEKQHFPTSLSERFFARCINVFTEDPDWINDIAFLRKGEGLRDYNRFCEEPQAGDGGKTQNLILQERKFREKVRHSFVRYLSGDEYRFQDLIISPAENLACGDQTSVCDPASGSGAVLLAAFESKQKLAKEIGANTPELADFHGSEPVPEMLNLSRLAFLFLDRCYRNSAGNYATNSPFFPPSLKLEDSLKSFRNRMFHLVDSSRKYDFIFSHVPYGERIPGSDELTIRSHEVYLKMILEDLKTKGTARIALPGTFLSSESDVKAREFLVKSGRLATVTHFKRNDPLDGMAIICIAQKGQSLVRLEHIKLAADQTDEFIASKDNDFDPNEQSEVSERDLLLDEKCSLLPSSYLLPEIYKPHRLSAVEIISLEKREQEKRLSDLSGLLPSLDEFYARRAKVEGVPLKQLVQIIDPPKGQAVEELSQSFVGMELGSDEEKEIELSGRAVYGADLLSNIRIIGTAEPSYSHPALIFTMKAGGTLGNLRVTPQNWSAKGVFALWPRQSRGHGTDELEYLKLWFEAFGSSLKNTHVESLASLIIPWPELSALPVLVKLLKKSDKVFGSVIKRRRFLQAFFSDLLKV